MLLWIVLVLLVLELVALNEMLGLVKDFSTEVRLLKASVRKLKDALEEDSEP